MSSTPGIGASTPGRPKRKARPRGPVLLAPLPAPPALAPPSAPATPAELAERLRQLTGTLQALLKEPSWTAMRRGIERAAEETAALAAAPDLGLAGGR